MLREPARAKVNLTLRVLGRRADGYHALESLVTFAEVGDVVGLEPGDEAAGGPLSCTGPFATQIEGENLLSRVLDTVREAAPALRLGGVHLEKYLPVAAGVGGGSADAAALIRLIQRANAGHPDLIRVDWPALAARLGADVPVCLAGHPAVMWGVGEKLEAMPSVAGAPASIPAVLVNPRVPLATRDVFRALAAAPVAKEAAPVMPRLASIDDVVGYMRAVGNDLEAPALRLLPVIGEVQAALRAQTGCLQAALSGSGPTCFGLYASERDANAAAAAILCLQPGWWSAATTLAFPG